MMDKPFTSGLNAEKEQAFSVLCNFLRSKDQVFVLTGYAGTGKTTLVKSLAEYCLENKIPITLLATTGRAAKVMARKTGFSSETLHRQIYSLDVSELDEKTQTKRVTFRLNQNSASLDRVYVVDESSMISDKPLAQSLTLFGTGSLLDDLFEFVGKRKLIFVGDLAQLPPVNSTTSPALSLKYLEKKYATTGTAVNLKDIMRYKPGSVIYENAQILLRTIHGENFRDKLTLYTSRHAGAKVFALDTLMIHDYVSAFRELGYEGCIFLTLSNRLATEVNRQVRVILYGGTREILIPGEVLMVQQNNYKFGITNGEHIEIVGVTGPEKTQAGLQFIPVEVKVNDYDGVRICRALLLKDYLELTAPRLSNEQEFKLMTEFMMRMRKKGIDPKKQAEEFKVSMMTDPYLNAIRARYGYAVTCHKAQGGEWQKVYIVLEKGLWNPSDLSLKFKWTYTAITRSEQELCLLENWAII